MTLDAAGFERVALAAIASLPAPIRAALVNVAVSVEEEHPDDPDLYGLYEGIPVTDAFDGAGELPATVRIFRRPLSEDFPDAAELAEEIRVTVLHELAHHFGIDEDRLDELGYA
jgi:predicted Zn-dependent protease with MMP-like domain